MACLPYHHHLGRLHFQCVSLYHRDCLCALHGTGIFYSIHSPSTTRTPLEVRDRNELCSSSRGCPDPLSGRGRRSTLRKFEEDAKKGLSSASSSSPECSTEVNGTDDKRPPFAINIAVVLAGFAFEAYSTPSENGRPHDTDPFGCKTTFFSEQFVRGVYDGKLWIHLKNGSQFPALDLWGTSDPYVVLRVGECVVRSRTVWATTTPVWNEQLEIHVKKPATQFLQVAAWDANLVTEDRRLGNSGVNLEHLSDGEKHEVRIELEGIGGGGVLTVEVQYIPFKDIDASPRGWKVPMLSDFFEGKGWDVLLKSNSSSDSLTVRDYLSSVLGSTEHGSNSSEMQEGSKEENKQVSTKGNDKSSAASPGSSSISKDGDPLASSAIKETMHVLSMALSSDPKDNVKDKAPTAHFFRDAAESFSQKFGINLDDFAFDKVNWDALDVIKKLGLESRKKADSHYVESGLALLPSKEASSLAEFSSVEDSDSPVEDVQKASRSLLEQTEGIIKTWAVIVSTLTGQAKSNEKTANRTTMRVKDTTPSASNQMKLNTSTVSNKKNGTVGELEELRKIFGQAESAMEAWAMLASSLGHRSLVKSAFEKLSFIDNNRTDTQVALWHDAQHRRVVVAFRGTEQVKWKDLRTDLMLLPVSFNPERIGGEFRDEAMVHGGFLDAYDSVKNKLMSLVKASIGMSNGNVDHEQPWHVYVTGHSLGGALATLFALELSNSQLSRHGDIKVTMYNFGSPRVGNKMFAARYNAILKDSWRVVNHRDIIPTVPRLMGYCHVARPVYLIAGNMINATANLELSEDGYHGDVIGEATPGFLIKEFMKGEKRLIERILQTEIAMIQSIRDGSALMQHMEDFYYISLLEKVSSNFRVLPELESRQNLEKDNKRP